jgi:hypothetical protein
MVEPEVVATSPYPIKSRVPVYCGFGSVKGTRVGCRGSSVVCGTNNSDFFPSTHGTRHSALCKMVLAVPMHRDTGVALDIVSLLLDYASSLRRATGASRRCCPGRGSLQKKLTGCCEEATGLVLAVKGAKERSRSLNCLELAIHKTTQSALAIGVDSDQKTR